MSFYDKLPEMFDPSAQEGTTGGPPPIPAGWYLALIIEAEVRDTQKGDGNYLFTTFEILDGDYLHRKVFQNIILNLPSEQAVEIGKRLLTDIYTSCGITEATQEIDVLLFKPVKIRVAIQRDQSGEFGDRNRIYSVRPQDFIPKRGPFAQATAPAPVTPMAAVKADLPWNK
jgi:hypothetical protein